MKGKMVIGIGFLLILVFVFVVLTTEAFKLKKRDIELNASWMNIKTSKKDTNYYMEVTREGEVLTRTETKSAIITKNGQVPVQLAKDFFREIENSEVMQSQDALKSKMVYYKGDMLQISAYIHGELQTINAPLSDFGEGFSYAFNQVRDAAIKFKTVKTLEGFITAQPLEGALLEEFNKRVSKDHEIKIVETYTIQKVKPLLKAIRQPHRLITINSKKELSAIQDLILKQQLYGLRNLFYISTTRGDFKCLILDAKK
jgi:hypothetical protein